MSSELLIRVSRVSIFIALSVVGAFIKIPGPLGSIALDSFPGYLSELLFGYIDGGIVIGFGHIISAMTVGFPLGILHLFIAIFMVVAGSLYRFVYYCFPTKNKNMNLISATILAATFNGFGGVIFSPILGWQFSIIITPFLLLASYVNVFLASVIYKQVKKTNIFRNVFK